LKNAIDGTIRDRMELPFLVGLQDHHSLLRRVTKNTQRGIERMMENGMPAQASTTGTNAAASEEDAAILNRCRIIHNHNYTKEQAPTTPCGPVVIEPFPVPPPQYPQARGVPVWMVVVLILLALSLAGVAAGATWWLAARPTPATPTPAPSGIQPGDDLHIKVIPGT
jgi:hypothetical protein